MRLFLLGLLACLFITPAAAQTAQAGVQAWERGDATAAVAIWYPLAQNGDADAAFNLAQAYRLGRGVAQNQELAQEWLHQAASAGHLKGQASLGLMLFQSGQKEAALPWLQKAASSGEARALLMIGTMTYNGDAIAQDPVKAYAYVSRAAAQGLPAARQTLSELDGLLTVEQRTKGVRMAQSMVGSTPKSAKPSQRSIPPVVLARNDDDGLQEPVPARPTPAIVKLTPKPVVRPTPKPVAIQAANTPAPVATGNWRIQLGAFGQKASASALFNKLSEKLPGRRPFLIPVGTMTRLQVGPFESKTAANAACARLAPQACFAVEAR